MKIKPVYWKISLLLHLCTAIYVIYKLIFSFYLPYKNQVKTPKYSAVQGYWLNRNEYLESLTIDSNSVIFMGDSHIQLCNLNEHFHDVNISNRGIIGDNVNGLKNRIVNVLESSPKKLIIEIGINDIIDGYRIKDIQHQFSVLFDSIKRNVTSTQVYFISIIPSDRTILNRESSALKEVIRMNKWLEKSCIKNGFHFIDVSPEFLSEEGINASLYHSDRLHLNSLGYQKLFHVLSNTLF
jgi:lysophospholipase L1-like esterase